MLMLAYLIVIEGMSVAEAFDFISPAIAAQIPDPFSPLWLYSICNLRSINV